MSPTWAVIDARGGGPGELGPAAMVAGIPLLTRVLRTAARLGWDGAAVCVREGQLEETRRLLGRYEIPAPLRVEIGTEAAAPAGAIAVALDGRGVYLESELSLAASGGRDALPEITVTTAAEARRARRLLYARIRKSIALDGVIAYYLLRPASRLLTRALLDTRVSPNAATLSALGSGITGAAFAAMGGALGAALAGAFYFLSGVLDCVDGELARLRLQSSRLGEWLDAASDELTTYSLLAGLGIGLARDGYGDLWATVAIVGALFGLLAAARQYRDLHRLGLPIDTAQYPWFFAGGDGARAESGERGALGKLFYGVGYLVRRDANVTGIALLLVFDLRRPAVAILAGMAGLLFLLTALHAAVTARRAVDRGEGT